MKYSAVARGFARVEVDYTYLQRGTKVPSRYLIINYNNNYITFRTSLYSTKD